MGLAGWNVVTTDNAWTGANFRRGGYLDHADRYVRAEEFLTVARPMWDSWADDAVAGDRSAPAWADPAAVTPVRVRSSQFDVEIVPTPQDDAIASALGTAALDGEPEGA